MKKILAILVLVLLIVSNVSAAPADDITVTSVCNDTWDITNNGSSGYSFNLVLWDVSGRKPLAFGGGYLAAHSNTRVVLSSNYGMLEVSAAGWTSPRVSDNETSCDNNGGGGGTNEPIEVPPPFRAGSPVLSPRDPGTTKGSTNQEFVENRIQ